MDYRYFSLCIFYTFRICDYINLKILGQMESSEELEKQRYLLKISQIEENFGDILIIDDGFGKSLDELKQLYENYTGQIHSIEERNCKETALRIIPILNRQFDKIDQKTTIFEKDCDLSISVLLGENSEGLFEHIGGKIYLGFPCHISNNPIDNANTVIYLIYKYILTLMYNDGHKSCQQALKASTKYLESKKILDKYMLLYSNEQRFRKYIFDHYQSIVQNQQVRLFRDFIAEQVLGNINLPIM